jgi:hypothetical protein
MAIRGMQLRVSAEPAPARAAALAEDASAATPGKTGEINLDNILKLIPGEVVPLYLTGIGLAVPAIIGISWRAIVFWLCLLTCCGLRIIASRPVGTPGILRGANLALVIVSLIAFFLWSHAVSTPGPIITGLPPYAWGFFAAIFGLFAPRLVPAG